MSDDSAVFLGGSGQEAGHIDQCDQWNVETVAETNETGRFHTRVDVQTTWEGGGKLYEDI